MSPIYDAIIIGGGQAGLAAGYHLQRTGLRFLILEAGDEPVGAWPHYYDSLSLNSAARYSSLPGLSFPGDPERYPARDEVAAYLRQYAAHFNLPVITGAPVGSVERAGRLFRVVTSTKGVYLARTVVAATGFFDRPHVPEMPGQAQYRGQVLHTADYHRPEPFRGQRVVIVGGANGAVHIGVELAQVARVTLTTRGSICYLPQRILGRDIHFWLGLSGLDRRQWLGKRSMLVYDDGACRAAIAAGQPDHRPLFKRFTEDGVIWSDGRHEKVDAVIFATGYRPHLPYLAGLNAFDEAGQVLHHEGISTTVPGLYYVGLFRQRSVASTTLRGVGLDAKVVIDRLQRYLETPLQPNARPSTGSLIWQAQVWSSRSSELVGLISLMALAFRQQSATEGISALPRLTGQALARSFTVGVGFLGIGNAATLYAS